MVKRNEQVWLQTSNLADKAILKKQIETFRKLQLRYQTIATKNIIETSQLKLL